MQDAIKLVILGVVVSVGQAVGFIVMMDAVMLVLVILIHQLVLVHVIPVVLLDVAEDGVILLVIADVALFTILSFRRRYYYHREEKETL